MGGVCTIQNYFDHRPGPGFLDYQCGNLGYDGHDGTDVRLPNLATMRQGVAVIAAATGRVRAVRDEMPDISIRDGNREAIRGREAGNAVVIRHGEDWETQYSHLLRGSVQVKPGEKVQSGQVLGWIGLSGKTEFPHLHFEVRYKGRPVDPFVGLHGHAACGTGPAPLWNDETLKLLEYRPTGLLQSGFALGVPEQKAVAYGRTVSGPVSPDAQALVFWIEIFGAQKGDTESLQLLGPSGHVIARKDDVIPKDKARWFSYAGRKRPNDGWPSGEYRVSYRLTRSESTGDQVVVSIDRTLTVK
jgi:murein DD-endopeptidase MepM/ murein hydrolase activator NlpD